MYRTPVPLLALNSLMNTDPDRSVPMLEKLLKSSNSPRLKERALFVLAQNRSQRSRELLAEARSMSKEQNHAVAHGSSTFSGCLPTATI